MNATIEKDCGAAAQPSDASPPTERQEKVVAKVPQGFDARVNIRLVPGRDFELHPGPAACRPRQGAARRDAAPVSLPETLVAKLKEGNRKVVDWLGRDPENAKMFLAKPLEALAAAGLELSRAEQKALMRSREAVGDVTVAAPGVKLAALTVAAYPKGRVGEIKPGSPTKPGRVEKAGCVHRGKE
jgi:hypothetical protein